jgi:hypothetical protein
MSVLCERIREKTSVRHTFRPQSCENRCVENEMNRASRTLGEILFEQYLESQSLLFEFEKKHAGKSKRPDYTIEWNGSPIIFDVKDFDAPDKLPTGFGFFDPYTRIREKIRTGSRKVQGIQRILLRPGAA